jgi:phage terminase large subunit-like protein
MARPDKVTRSWICGPADEQAIAEGCRFDTERALHAVEWIERTCHLYEGDMAGELIRLMPWQREFISRLFGWVRYSKRLGRWVRRFNRAILFVPKKNGKSPLLAAIGLYLLAGDGEKGQKVYSVAKDGKQAMIAHRHAVEMVRRSPSLSRLCKINKGTGLIVYQPESGAYSVVAGDNQNSQEGLNGSVMTDETHVVDRRLARILRGAGISRSEPLHVEVSTAGNDPDSYGKERFDYAAETIRAGGDIRTLCVIYAAPQDLSPADLDADPTRWGREANPSWGVTIDPDEYLAEYAEALTSLSGLLDFMMYRLNVWQQAASPWLRAADWQRCRRDFTEEDLAGQECYAGLDLSRTRDMCALVLAFPEAEEGAQLLAYFWLPEDRAAELAHLAPYRQWAAAGHLVLTPGNVVDYGFIKREFRRLAAQFQIRELAFDRQYAEDLTQDLADGETDDAGNVVAEGTGVVRYEFSQTVTEYACPTADFERGVIAGTISHNGHPVMAWQAGHVKVRTDANQNKRPVKPKPGDHRAVDGIQAAIMATARAKLARGASAYETKGITVF